MKQARGFGVSTRALPGKVRALSPLRSRIVPQGYMLPLTYTTGFDPLEALPRARRRSIPERGWGVALSHGPSGSRGRVRATRFVMSLQSEGCTESQIDFPITS